MSLRGGSGCTAFVVRCACGHGDTRPVAAGERVGGQAVRNHAEQDGEGNY